MQNRPIDNAQDNVELSNTAYTLIEDEERKENNDTQDVAITVNAPQNTDLAGLIATIDAQDSLKGLEAAYTHLEKADQKALLDYYIKKHLCEYRTVQGHAWFGYAGEAFYLYWDWLARKQTIENLIPSIPSDVNWYANVAATAFITHANVTYSPNAEATGYMRNKMLNPDSSLGNQIKLHPVLASMFVLYAFGGGYIEVAGIDEWLNDNCGSYKYAPIAALMYSAILYYTAFNFQDTINGCGEWLQSESLLKKAFARGQGTIGDRITAAFVALHESMAFVERIARIGLGGFYAGGYPLAATTGFGTAIVATGTRCWDTVSRSFPSNISNEAINIAKEKYELAYQESPIKHEAKLLLSPALCLMAPAAYFAYQYGADDSSGTKQILNGALYAAVVSGAMHLVTRHPAKKKEIIQLAQEAMPQNDDAIKPNKAAVALSWTSSLLDQASRTLTLGFALQTMFPSTFGETSKDGSSEPITPALILAFGVGSFIASSAFNYQRKKVENSTANMLPRFFAQKSAPANIAVVEDVSENNRTASLSV